MATIFLSGPTNSQMFTTCCEVAIVDNQNNCPRCRAEVIPAGNRARWETAYRPIAKGWRGYGNWYPNHGKR